MIPRDLIASELFGHEKGAFTGATQRRLGRFELAEKGTIFLDEIGELPAETQIALLRVLQEHEFERIGGTGTLPADVRVIAATNRDLEAAIAAGTFRSDLFYRLNVFPIEMPTLRERNEDIPLLVGYFLERYGRKAGKSFQTVNKQSLDLLQSYPWPGNIRELQNVIERSVIVSDGEIFSVDESWLSRQHRTHEPKNVLQLSQKLAARWIAINSNFAKSLGWFPSNAQPFEWLDGSGQLMVKSVMWRDGWVGLEPPHMESLGEGWLVLATTNAIKAIVQKRPDSSLHLWVERHSHGNKPSQASWHLMSPLVDRFSV